MNKATIGYWVTTALVALVFIAGGAMDMSGSPEVLEVMKHLGYPAYFATMLGVWKVLGGVVVLAPGLPRLKEWAYAGMTFDLVAASVSHAVSGDEASAVITPVVILGLVAASWALRPASRKLVAPGTATQAAHATQTQPTAAHA